MQNQLLPHHQTATEGLGEGQGREVNVKPTYQEQSALVDQLCGVWRLKNQGRFYSP